MVGPWAPPVSSIELIAGEKTGPDLSDRPEWEQEYLSSETALRFEVHMPAGEEYTPRFRFSGDDGSSAMRDARAGGMGGKLVFWPAAAPRKLPLRVAKQLGHDTVGSEVARSEAAQSNCLRAWAPSHCRQARVH